MAASPAFAATPLIGIANINAANTARDGSGTIPTVVTAGANGALISRVVVKAETDPADCVVILWIHNGSIAYLFDEFDIGDPAAGSTTVVAYRVERAYTDLVLPTGYSLRATITVAPTTGDINVFAFGGDF